MIEESINQPQFRKGRADGSRKLRLAKKAEGERNLAQMMIFFGWFLVILFLFAVCSTLFSINHKEHLSEYGVSANAVVKNVELVSHTGKTGNLTSYSVIIKASYTSTDHSTQHIERSKFYPANEISNRARVGDLIEVRYNSNNPSDCLVPEWESDPEWFLISFLLVFGFLNIYLGKNYKELRFIRP